MPDTTPAWFRYPFYSSVGLGYEEDKNLPKSPDDIAADMDYRDQMLEDFLNNLANLTVVGAPISEVTGCCGSGSQTFSYNGTDGTDGSGQSFVVPTGITTITVDASGAEGGTSGAGAKYGAGGLGGNIVATVAVTPGETLFVYVGGSPETGSANDKLAGYNGGGEGGTASGGAGGGGGGASDVRRSGLADRLIVAGGGGGNSQRPAGGPPGPNGGAGGGLTGGDGTNTGGFAGAAGSGGTQSAGGAEGTIGDTPPHETTSGTLGVGGNGWGDSSQLGLGGGGGGGGLYGGGGGDETGGGGGGSSGTTGTIVSNTQGVRSGHGTVTISWGEAVYTGYTPTWTQTATITKTINNARYTQIGQMVSGNVLLTATSAGTAGANIVVGLPVNYSSSVTALTPLGSWYYLVPGTNNYTGTLVAASNGPASTCQLIVTGASPDPFGTAPAVTVASTDKVGYSFNYEATG